MTEHSADLSKLLSLDKTITSQLNWAVFFKKHHMQSAVQNSQSQVFLLLPRTSVMRALEIGNNPLFYRAR